jgi:rubrerythrin
MRDDNVDNGKNIEELELVECGICGYHHQKTKKCPQCSIKEAS